MRKTKTAFVTGAEGFIGSHLLRFLAAKGWTVIGTHRLHSCSLVPQATNICLVHCDLRNGQRLTGLLREHQVTHIFHLAAQSLPTVSWVDPVDTFESNIMGSLNLLEAVRYMKHPPVVVCACSSAEYGHVPPSAVPVTEEQPLRPLHPYGISKVCLDLLAQEYYCDYGVPTVNLRLFNTTGPAKTDDAPSDFVRQLVRIKHGLQSPVIKVGNLKPRRAFLDVNDTVHGFYLAAMKAKHGQAYNLCADTTYEMGELLHIAVRLSGVKARICPSAHLMRPSDESIIFGNADKFRRDTGWLPRLSIEHTLASMLDYWEQQYSRNGAHRLRTSLRVASKAS